MRDGWAVRLDSDDAEIQSTRDAMVRLITRTLIQTVRLPVGERQVKPPLAYERFVAALLRSRNAVVQRTARAGTSPAMMALNHDVGLDYALHFSGTRFDYGTTEGTLPPDAVRLLKLHGSINWAACPTCNVLVPWHLSQFFQGHNWNIIPFGDDEDRTAASGHCRPIPSVEARLW